MKGPLHTAGAARAVGVSQITLQRWIGAGRVRAPELVIRNGRAVRLWKESDIARLRKTKEAVYCRGRGRKKKAWAA